MVKLCCMRFLAACLLVLAACSGALAQPVPGQALTAFVDRTDISLNDVLTLTIRVDASLGNNRPSFAGLSQDFEQVGGMSTRSTYTNNNGNIQSWTEYNITLRPLRTGELQIPEFRVAGQATSPITIRVGEASADQSSVEDIFLRTSISKQELYVQEQFIYTIRIYYVVGFDQGAQLSSPQVQNAVVQPFGSDRNFQEVVDGIGYNVTERRFVIFPQNSGTLTIPPVTFQASIGRRGGINRLFNNRATVREVNIASEAHTLNVKPRPASFPGNTWLPASDLTLEESWSGDLDNVTVGDAITRNIVLTARGLSSSLLPGIDYQDLPGLRFYPDQPTRQDVADATGVIGTRSEGMAMVASRPGEFEIPEVRLPWWDTDTDTLQFAVLPARIINVRPAGDADIDPSAITPLPRNEILGPAGTLDSSAQRGGASVLWIGTTVAFGLAWLLTLFMLLAQRRQLATGAVGVAASPLSRLAPRPAGSASVATATTAPPAVMAAIKLLQQACQAGEPAAIRKAVIDWGRAVWPDARITTLAAVARLAGNAELEADLKTLDARLYGQGTAADLDARALYRRIVALHKAGIGKDGGGDRYALPPLYRQ